MVAAIVTVPCRLEANLSGQELISGFLRAVAGRPERCGEAADLAGGPGLDGAVQFPGVTTR